MLAADASGGHGGGATRRIVPGSELVPEPSGIDDADRGLFRHVEQVAGSLKACAPDGWVGLLLLRQEQTGPRIGKATVSTTRSSSFTAASYPGTTNGSRRPVREP